MSKILHILIIAVCHDSYSELRTYLQSIDVAAQHAKDIQVDILIADNSMQPESIRKEDYPHCYVMQKQVDNLGYFGSARAALNTIQTEDYTHMVISNVDLKMETSFFTILKTLVIDKDVTCIAPSLVSCKEQQERNPEYAERPTRKHLQLARLLYIHPLTLSMYERMVYQKRTPKQTPETTQTIFAPHGSFILFIGNTTLPKILHDFTPFLYCEELYVGEIIRSRNERTIFEPRLKVYDYDHVTTSRMSNSFLCRCHREALRWLVKHYK